MRVTAFYGGLLVPLFIMLSLHVIRRRLHLQLGVGDGADSSLLRRIRVHANFAEYVPMTLLLMGLAESRGAAPELMHLLGLTLLFARAAHVLGMLHDPEWIGFRKAGITGTFLVLAGSGALCVFLAL